MKRAALYVRVSTSTQADEGLSIPAQQKLLKEYAVKNSYTISDEHIYIDAGESAKTADRPQFQLMIANAKQTPKPFDAVLVHKTDRFARNRLDSAVYKTLLRKECGINVVSITENFSDDPYGMMMEGIMELFAEFYSLNLSVEVTKGMTQAAESGIVLGRVPFGYDIDPETNKYIINQKQAEIVRYIFKMYVEQGYGMDKIHTYMTSRTAEYRFGDIIKIQASKAKKKIHLMGKHRELKWSSNAISYMLKNDAYIGTYRWKPENEEEKVLLHNHPAIICESTFYEAQELIARRRNRRTSERHEYMLRGLVKCSYCGRTMVIHSTKRKNGSYYRYLRCTNKNQDAYCRKNSIPYEAIESLIINDLTSLFKNINLTDKISLEFSSINENEKIAQKLQAALVNFDVKFDKYMEAFESGIINIDQLKKYREKLAQEKKDLQKELKQAEVSLQNTQIDEAELLNIVASVAEILKGDEITEYDKQRVLGSVVERVVVDRVSRVVEIFYKGW